MKKDWFSFFRLYMMIFMFICPLMWAQAEDFNDKSVWADDLHYKVNTTTMHAQLYKGPRNIISFIIPEQITADDGNTYTVTDIYKDAFKNCKIEEITVPVTITAIGENVFHSMHELHTVHLPSTLTSIGEKAFSASGIMSIDLPQSLQKISDQAFAYCFNLTTITLPKSIIEIGAKVFQSCENLRTAYLRCAITEIPKGTFKWCDNFVGGEWPSNIARIGDEAFYGCPALREIDMPLSVREIGNESFYQCTALRRVGLGSVERIGDKAFYDCQSLTNVDFPPTLSTLGSLAFAGCTGLTSLNFCNITSIDGSFVGCTGIRTVTILRNVTDTGSSFSGGLEHANNIRELIIGPDVTDLTSIRFWGNFTSHTILHIRCDALTPPELYKGYYSATFSKQTYDNADLEIPASAEEAYRAHPLWKRFFHDSQIRLEALKMNVNTGIFMQDWVVRYTDLHGNLVTPYVWPKGSCWNNDKDDVKTDYGIGLYDKNGKLVQVVNYITPLHFAPWQVQTMAETKPVGENVEDGDYFLTTFTGNPYNDTDVPCWLWWEKGNYVPVYIYEDTIAFYERLYDDFYIKNGHMIYKHPRINHVELYSFRYLNDGNKPCQRDLYLFLDEELMGHKHVKLLQHDMWFSRFSFIVRTPGKKKLTITSDSEGKKILWYDKVEFEDDSSGGDETMEENSLLIQYVHNKQGVIKLPAPEDESMKLRLLQEEGWIIHRVYLDEEDVTDNVSASGELIVPPISGISDVRVVMEQTTSIATPTNPEQNIQLFLHNGSVTLRGTQAGHQIRVYTLNGMFVGSYPAAEGETSVSLPHSHCYIVQYDTKRFKLMIQ